MARNRSIHDQADDLYDDEQLALAVIDDADRLGTVKDIEAGRKTLPHPDDAAEWYARKTGKVALTPEQQQERSRQAARDQLLEELADLAVNPNPERAAIIKKRIAELRNPDGGQG